MPRVNGIQFLNAFAQLRVKIDISTCVIMMFSTSEREEDKANIMGHEFVKDYLVKGAFTSQQLKEY